MYKYCMITSVLYCKIFPASNKSSFKYVYEFHPYLQFCALFLYQILYPLKVHLLILYRKDTSMYLSIVLLY